MRNIVYSISATTAYYVFDEGCLWENWHVLDASHAGPEPEESSRSAIGKLRARLEAAGFRTMDKDPWPQKRYPQEPDDLPEECAFAFQTGDDSAQLRERINRFLEPDLAVLKEEISNITPEEFADCDMADRLRDYAGGKNGQYAWVYDYRGHHFTHELQTLADFMRHLTPHDTYYVATAVAWAE